MQEKVVIAFQTAIKSEIWTKFKKCFLFQMYKEQFMHLFYLIGNIKIKKK